MSDEIIQGILPAQEVSIIAGASGAGKTTLIMQVLADIQAGAMPLGHEAAQGLKLGYIAADRTWRSYQKTASGVKLDLNAIKVRALIDDPDINLARFEARPLDLLEELIASLLPCDLVVVDPLVVFLGCDTNKYHLNAARLIRLNKFCLANKVTILGTHHATKARSDFTFKRAQDRISGTSALLGFTSSQLFLAAPDETGREDGFHEFHVVSHHAPPKVILLSRSDGVFKMEREEVKAPPVAIEDQIIAAVIASGSLPRQQILFQLAEGPGAPSRASIDRALGSLVENGTLSRASGTYAIAEVAARA